MNRIKAVENLRARFKAEDLAISATCAGRRPKYEVILPKETCVEAQVSKQELTQLIAECELVKVLLLEPGCGPGWYWVAVNSNRRELYEVVISYKHRPTVEFDPEAKV